MLSDLISGLGGLTTVGNKCYHKSLIITRWRLSHLTVTVTVTLSSDCDAQFELLLSATLLIIATSPDRAGQQFMQLSDT